MRKYILSAIAVAALFTTAATSVAAYDGHGYHGGWHGGYHGNPGYWHGGYHPYYGYGYRPPIVVGAYAPYGYYPAYYPPYPAPYPVAPAGVSLGFSIR